MTKFWDEVKAVSDEVKQWPDWRTAGMKVEPKKPVPASPQPRRCGCSIYDAGCTHRWKGAER